MMRLGGGVLRCVLGWCFVACGGALYAQEPAETGAQNPPGAFAADAVVVEFQARFGQWHANPATAVELAAVEECRIALAAGVPGVPQPPAGTRCSWTRTAFSVDGSAPWGFTFELVYPDGSSFVGSRSGAYNTRQTVPDAVFDLSSLALAAGCVLAFGVGYIGGRQR
jgi:hypothetical protein